MPVLSDECYAEFTWDGPPRTILESGSHGVVAVHSLSKRSNLAGVRAGFYAGDPDLVTYLLDVRRHAGLMVPGPVQAGAVVALDDDAHVDEQRGALPRAPAVPGRRPDRRPGCRSTCRPGRSTCGCPCPTGSPTVGRCATWLADEAGLLVSPGELYGPDGSGHVRVAVVQPMDRLELVATRLG